MRRYAVLYMPRKDGSIMAKHCEGYLESKGEWPDEYPLPEVPEYCVDVWNWYFELRRATAAGANGPSPISYSEIMAWKSLLGLELKPLEVEQIRLLDDQYLTTYSELHKVTKPKSIPKRTIKK